MKIKYNLTKSLSSLLKNNIKTKKETFFSIASKVLCFSQLFIYGHSFAQCNSPALKIRAGNVSPLCDITKLDWGKWSTVNNTSSFCTVSSNINISVNKPTGGLGLVSGMACAPNTFPATYNVPVNNPSVSNSLAGLFTFCFNKPVFDPLVAFASIGQPGTPVSIKTSATYQVIWPGTNMTYPSCTEMIGEEGMTVVKFPGVHTCVSFDYLVSENYCTLAFGVADTNCQTSGPITYCAGSGRSNTLTAVASGGIPPYTYSWLPATGLNTVNGDVVIATPATTTKYYATAMDSNGLNMGKDSIIVTIDPSPTITVNSPSICVGQAANLIADGGASYTWSEGVTLTGVNTAYVSPTTTTTYTVIGAASGGCTGVAAATVKVDGSDPNLFVPNTFTPNGDGLNDLFKVGDTSLSEFEATIYNRWGEKIYTWNNSKSGWDGTKNGISVPEGVYVSLIKTVSQCSDRAFEYNKVITLLR